MATACPNCGGALIFKPELEKLYCSKCGGTFGAQETDNGDKELLEDIKAVPMNEVYGFNDPTFVDRNIYTCENCGGEVVVTDTEVSTYCIYCGNPTVVFSRVAKQKRTDSILPFTVTKEDAMKAVRERIDKGFFIPPSLKKKKIDNIRGIYIPYNIVSCDHRDAILFRGKKGRGRYARTVYFKRHGSCRFKNIPLDASTKLNDELSSRLEPFDLHGLKEFNEDYLAGFYSDMPDVTKADIDKAASRRCEELFIQKAKRSVKADGVKVVSNHPHTTVSGDPVYAMLPAWFVTFEYKKKPHTILINGQTGKVVCALTWSKPMFFSLMILTALGIAAVATLILYFLVSLLFLSKNGGSSGRLLGVIVVGAIGALTIGIQRYGRIMKQIKLTQSSETMNFVKRRQG